MIQTTANLPSIVFVNVHKGASTFIADEFATVAEEVIKGLRVVRFGSEILTGSSPAQMPVPDRGAMFTRVYPSDIDDLVFESPDNSLSGTKLVLMIRDPRDVAVSMYFSTAYSHSMEVRNPPELLRRREELSKISEEEGLVWMLKPAARQFRAIRQLAKRYPDALLVSYEELVQSYNHWLNRFSDHVGWSASQSDQIYERTFGSFEPPTHVDPTQHKRRITPGNWQELFTEAVRAAFENELGDELGDAGYYW